MLRWLERKLTYKPDKVIYADITPYSFQKHVIEGDGESTTVYTKLSSNQPTILFSHGNTGNVTFHTWYYDFFESLGVSYVAYDYPGYGESLGKPCEAALYRSGEAVWKYLTQTCGRKPEDIFHFGLSLGGGVALDLASKHPSQGVILECTFTDSHDMARHIYPKIPLYKFVPNRFQNRKKISSLNCPVLILHGTEDPTVPVRMAHSLHEAHSGKKELCIIEGAMHADVGQVGKNIYRDAIASFLGKT